MIDPGVTLAGTVEALGDRDELIAASGGDVFVRSSVPPDPRLRGWLLGEGVAWYAPSPHRDGAGWLTVAADPSLVPMLVEAATRELPGQVRGVTVPAASLRGLPIAVRPNVYEAWDWFWTATMPPVHPLEDAVAWARAGDEAHVAELLDRDSPRHSARPGDATTQRWAVLRADRDATSDLLACGAHVEYVPQVPHLASIVTRTDQRGRGLGGAVTAWLTRRILAEGSPIVTLGMYGDNDTARRLYRRLGYTDTHHWASGRLPSSLHGNHPVDNDPVDNQPDGNPSDRTNPHS